MEQLTFNNDPLIQLSQGFLRQANLAMLPISLKKLEERLKSRFVFDPIIEIGTKILTAEIYRVLNDTSKAIDLVSSVINNLRFNRETLFSDAQRLLVGLFLDQNNIAQALELVGQIEIETAADVNGQQSSDFIKRKTNQISIETRLIEAETFLYAGRISCAVKSLTAAGQNLSEEENLVSKQRYSASQILQNEIKLGEMRFLLHFWGALIQIASGVFDEGYESLLNLRAKLEKETKLDRRIIARVRSTLGEYEVGMDLPPAGIGILEARRLLALTRFENSERAHFSFDSLQGNDQNLIEADTESIHSSSIITQNFNNQNQLSPQTSPISFDSVVEEQKPLLERLVTAQDATQKQMAALLVQLDGITEQLPLQNIRASNDIFLNASQKGFNFKYFMVTTLLHEAEQSEFTGFFHVRWSPEVVEPAVLVGDLDSRARAGRGFIFICNGTIIDAVIGSFDCPEEYLPGTNSASEDAKQSLAILLQIAANQAIGFDSQSFGEPYVSEAVAQRKPRLAYRSINLANLIQLRDIELYNGR